MRSAEEWCNWENNSNYTAEGRRAKEEWVECIQRDALDAAAAVCDDEDQGYAAETAVAMAAIRIRALKP